MSPPQRRSANSSSKSRKRSNSSLDMSRNRARIYGDLSQFPAKWRPKMAILHGSRGDAIIKQYSGGSKNMITRLTDAEWREAMPAPY
ncbi:hypothetical protein ACEQ8H_002350 [Pleosporales sp. CAS-2024a]